MPLLGWGGGRRRGRLVPVAERETETETDRQRKKRRRVLRTRLATVKPNQEAQVQGS